jgi:hypothetical protein
MQRILFRAASDAIEEGKALADAEPLVMGLPQFRDLSVLAAACLGEPGRRVEAIGDAVVADRDVGVRALDDLNCGRPWSIEKYCLTRVLPERG